MGAGTDCVDTTDQWFCCKYINPSGLQIHKPIGAATPQQATTTYPVKYHHYSYLQGPHGGMVTLHDDSLLQENAA